MVGILALWATNSTLFALCQVREGAKDEACPTRKTGVAWRYLHNDDEWGLR
jgi:hypothetical protein